jgi:hypothetical protein
MKVKFNDIEICEKRKFLKVLILGDSEKKLL